MGQLLCKARRVSVTGSRKRGREGHSAERASNKQQRCRSAAQSNYLSTLHATRAYFKMSQIREDSHGYYYEHIAAPRSLTIPFLDELIADTIGDQNCRFDLNWRPPRMDDTQPREHQVSLGAFMVILVARALYKEVRHPGTDPRLLKRAAELAAALADQINRGHMDVEQHEKRDNLVLHCGGLLHSKLPKPARSLACAVLKRSKDVNVVDKRGSTIMHVVAEDCFFVGDSLFHALYTLHKHGCDFNARDSRGCTPLHEIVDSGDHECLFRLLELELPGIDCYVRDNEQQTFMRLAKRKLIGAYFEGACSQDYSIVDLLCDSWVARWQSAMRSALQPHLPVVSGSDFVLADIVMQYIDGTGEAFDKPEKDAAIDAEIAEMLAAPVAMPAIEQ